MPLPLGHNDGDRRVNGIIDLRQRYGSVEVRKSSDDRNLITEVAVAAYIYECNNIELIARYIIVAIEIAVDNWKSPCLRNSSFGIAF